MHILNRTLAATLAAAFILTMACSPRGPLSPEEAFGVLQKAYHRNDPGLMLEVLSGESVSRIHTMTALIATMNERQREKMAEQFGVGAGQLAGLSPTAYLALQMRLARTLNEDAMGRALDSGILKSQINDARATLTAQNGMELSFVKEGPYWKFDMTDW
ncbi:MAG TPA: hypothetical protein VLM75_02385 [Spirochaetota bacterium]|nr:hypothetical protein [Spirochaetota bacterium]